MGTNEIQAGETVRFTEKGIDTFLKKGDDVSGTYKVTAATETHLTLERIDGPFPIPGVTPETVSARRDMVERV